MSERSEVGVVYTEHADLRATPVASVWSYETQTRGRHRRPVERDPIGNYVYWLESSDPLLNTILPGTEISVVVNFGDRWAAGRSLATSALLPRVTRFQPQQSSFNRTATQRTLPTFNVAVVPVSGNPLPFDRRKVTMPSSSECYDEAGKGDAMAQGLSQKLDYDDLAHTPDDNRRYELLDGVLFVTPSPRPLHQRVSKRLQRQLETYFEGKGLGEVFNAPVDVILTLHDVVVPDLVVVTTPPQVTDRAIEGPPAIIVEILSPTTRMRDRKLKAERYAALGVPHYWIVDPVSKTLECYRLESGRYTPVLTAESPSRASHPDWPDLTIDLGVIWR